MAQIRIVLADDHTIIRSGLRLLLEQQPDFKVVAEAEDGRQAVQFVSKHHPDVVILDIGMPQLNGIEATRQIVAEAKDKLAEGQKEKAESGKETAGAPAPSEIASSMPASYPARDQPLTGEVAPAIRR